MVTPRTAKENNDTTLEETNSHSTANAKAAADSHSNTSKNSRTGSSRQLRSNEIASTVTFPAEETRATSATGEQQAVRSEAPLQAQTSRPIGHMQAGSGQQTGKQNRSTTIKSIPEYSILLMQTRTSFNLSIEDITNRLRIRKAYIEAFETGATHDYPPEAYVRGFLRTYARYLRLDDDEIIRSYQRQLNSLREQEAMLREPEPHRSFTRADVWLVVLLIGLVALVGFWGWRILQTDNLSSPQPISSEAPAPAPAPAPDLAAVNPIDQTITEDAAAISDIGIEETAVSSDSLDQSESEAITVNAIPLSNDEFSQATDRLLRSLPANSIIIAANRETWLEIRDAENVVILSRILGVGETYIVPRRSGLTLTSGNAGHTVIHYEPGKWSDLGQPNALARNIPLERQQLSKYFAQQALQQ